MEQVLRIGVVGCGAMGREHVRMWGALDGARVAAVCDADDDRARAVARACGAEPFADLDEMTGSGRVDAIDLCTPSGLHADQGLTGARHGLHVFTEKPLDLDYGKALRLVQECENRGLTLGCMFQRRAYAGAQAVARAVAEGRMGRVLLCSVAVKWWRPQAYYDSAAWRGSLSLDGGVLANQAIHAIDHMNWLAGPVADVEYAHLATERHDMEAEDLALAVLRFENGARGIIEATTCAHPALCSRLELVCSDGAASFDDATVTAFGAGGEDLLSTIGPPAEPVGGRSDPMAIRFDGHQAVLADFAAAIREKRPPLCDGRSALLSVDTLARIYAKARA